MNRPGPDVGSVQPRRYTTRSFFRTCYPEIQLSGNALATATNVAAARTILLGLRAGDITAGRENEGGDSESEQHQRAAGH